MNYPHLVILLLVWAICCRGAVVPDSSKTNNGTTVVVIPVEGNVNAALSAFINRAVKEGGTYPDPVFIFEMDTYGGEVDAAFQIVDTLVNIRGATTVAYVKTKAISAGALIALACDKMVMKKSTTIGDVAPLTMSNDGPKMLGEKFQSPIRAKFRTLAKRNGYHETLTESMVTEALTVFRVEFADTVMYLDSTGLADLGSVQKKRILKTSTVVRSGELLTMDDAEAVELGFSKGSVSSFDGVLELLGLSDAKIVRLQRTWSELMVGFIGKIAPVLMMIGLAALYIEIRSPGFGIPGIVGIVCLATVFLGQYMVGLADYTEFLLLAIGVVLLAIEIVVLPGFGIAGIAGIGFILVAMVLSLQGFVLPRPDFPWEKQLLVRNLMYASGSLVGAVGLIVLFFRFVFPRLGAVVSGPYLNATLSGVHTAPENDEHLKAGDCGVVVTALRPSGKAKFGESVFDVVAEGVFVEKGETVIVSEVNGNRIVVGTERQP
jgi:membrane-bound serine protease (ClpP class)